MISRDARARINAEIAKYPARRGALLPALHIVQSELGFVSPETATELAELFEIRPVDVMEVVSFYNMYYATPQPRHHVYVCTNLPCSLRGAHVPPEHPRPSASAATLLPLTPPSVAASPSPLLNSRS